MEITRYAYWIPVITSVIVTCTYNVWIVAHTNRYYFSHLQRRFKSSKFNLGIEIKIQWASISDREIDIFSFCLKQTTNGLVLIYLMFAEEMRLNNNINVLSNETRLTPFHCGNWNFLTVYFLPIYLQTVPWYRRTFADDLFVLFLHFLN